MGVKRQLIVTLVTADYVVNGHAVGIAATILGLMDAVYCTEKTWLHTPFTRLGLCPEGCSSFTFPRIMGLVKSNEMLLFSKKVTADEALKAGLVTEVFPVSTFDSTVWLKLKEISELPPQVLIINLLFLSSYSNVLN